MTDSRWIDPEIEGILDGDPELTELANRVRAARPEPALDPRFRNVLRAQLMREAPAALGSAAKAERQTAGRPRTIRGRRVGWWQRPQFAWGGVTLGAALVAAAVFTVARTPVHDHQQVTAMSPVASLHAVSPDNVITVAFSQPMNESAVVAGLHVRPATEITTSWRGNSLLITPKHHLAGNTPYTVTIERSATRASNGQLAAGDIRISFGTAPTPPPAQSPAQLAPQTLGPVGENSQLISAGGGTVVATSSTAATSAPTSLQPSPAGSSSTTPSTAASASPTTSASPSSPPAATGVPAPTGELVALTADGGATNLGPAVTSAALDPNGLRLVAAVPTATGTTIELVPLDGSNRRVLVTLAAPVLATGWLSAETALVAEPDRIVSVDLLGHVNALTTLPPDTSRVAFSPAGAHAFAGSASRDGALIDLGSPAAQPTPLPGSRETAAFSGDGSLVAWVDAGTSPARLLTSPVSRQAVAAVPLNHPGDSIPAIALDRTGTHVAVVDRPASGGGELDVLALPSGSLIARGSQATAPAFSTQGDRLAYISGGVAAIAAVPGSAPGSIANPLPDGAASALKAFVDAQVEGNGPALATLSDPGVDAMGSTPHGLSRAYVISAVSNPDGTVAATARLIVDASGTHTAASFADESLVLSPKADGTYAVSSLQALPLRDVPIGPHVVSVVPVAGPTLVLRVSFDSDLRAATVPGAITVATRSGRTLTVSTVYDANTRTATVTTTVASDTTVVLTVATTLVDIDGQALAGAFRTQAGG